MCIVIFASSTWISVFVGGEPNNPNSLQVTSSLDYQMISVNAANQTSFVIIWNWLLVPLIYSRFPYPIGGFKTSRGYDTWKQIDVRVKKHISKGFCIMQWLSYSMEQLLSYTMLLEFLSEEKLGYNRKQNISHMWRHK